MSLPDYNNPPVIEVAIGCSFKPLKEMTLLHLGSYWEKIRDEYPGCEQMPPAGRAEPVSKHYPFPFPRIWFISEDESHLIQIQNGRFICNWRKQKENMDYPRYDTLITKFQQSFASFCEFTKKEGLGEFEITECELTYTNHIHYNELCESPSEVSKIIPDFGWRQDEERFLPAPDPQLWRLHFELPENSGVLRVELKHAQRIKDKVPLFILQLATRGLGQKNEHGNLQEWYDISHEWIVRAFADLTSEEAQNRMWGKINTE